MTDPLLVLRDALLQNPENPLISYLNGSGEAVSELTDAEYIRLGSSKVTFPRQCPTNFKSKRGTGPFYTLDAVIFVLKHRDDSFSVYLQEARKRGLSVVSLVDKKDLVEYLTVAGADSQYVDHGEPLPQPVRGFKHVRADAAHAEDVSSAALDPNVSKMRQVRTRNYDYVTESSFAFIHASIKQVLGISETAEKKPAPRQKESRSGKPGKSLMDHISSINQPHLVPSETRHKDRTGVPIIIIPNAPSSLITLFNVKEWLERSRFVMPADAKAAATSKPSSVMVSFQFEGGDQPTQFMIIDAPSMLSSSDWNRVVAAVVLGNTWQFKGWKWTSPVDIFSNLVGFYVQWDDVQSDPVIGQWNVRRINISRSRRHLDSTSVLEFWHHLGQSMKGKGRHSRQ